MNHHTLSLPNSDLSFKMIHIEEGIFDMGSNNYDWEKPIHKVKLSEFWLCEVPVTQALWTAVMGSNPSYFQGADRPVETVSWDDIMDEKQGFLTKINKDTEGVRPRGSLYRLPTEAEWEYAARGGKYANEYPFTYSGSDKLEEVGWYNANSHGETKPVGLKAPNFLGLYDMSGNVWERCEDVYDEYFYEDCHLQGVIWNPCNQEKGTRHVNRGGCWHHITEFCLPTCRDSTSPTSSPYNVGLRLVLFIPSVKAF